MLTRVQKLALRREAP